MKLVTTILLTSALVTPALAAVDDGVLDRLTCLEAQLSASLEVIENPTVTHRKTLTTIPNLAQDGTKMVAIPGANIEIPSEFSGHTATITYTYSAGSSDSSKDGHNIEARNFMVNSVWINGDEIVPLRSIQGGYYHGNTGSWTGALPDNGPFNIEMRYRSNRSENAERGLGDWRVIYLEAVIHRKPVWPVDVCGPRGQ